MLGGGRAGLGYGRHSYGGYPPVDGLAGYSCQPYGPAARGGGLGGSGGMRERRYTEDQYINKQHMNGGRGNYMNEGRGGVRGIIGSGGALGHGGGMGRGVGLGVSRH